MDQTISYTSTGIAIMEKFADDETKSMNHRVIAHLQASTWEQMLQLCLSWSNGLFVSQCLVDDADAPQQMKADAEAAIELHGE